MIRIWMVLVVSMIHIIGFSQNEPALVARAKSVVEVGERFQIVYELNADGQNFASPSFGKLQILSGPNRSSSSNIQIINGKMQQSYTLTHTFIAVANEEGEFETGPASIVVDGKKIVSNSLTIKAVKSTQSKSNQSPTTQGNKQQDGVLQNDDLYIKTLVSKSNPYLGEEIIVTLRLYTKVPIANLALQKAPSFTGFWSKSLSDNNSQLQQSRQIINGEEYTVADIIKYAVFPQKNGKLTIEPAELECVAQLQVQRQRAKSNDPFDDFFNDPFFNRNVRNVEKTLVSDPVTVDVLALPEAGRPADFQGAVGDFNFISSIDNNELTTNDALTLSMTVSGKGNLELVDLPKPKFPSDFETYDPKVTSDINTSLAGISGKKKFEYLAIPRAPGDFVISPVTFSFFNPKEKKYFTYSTGEINISVTKGSQTSGGITYSSSAQEDIKYIGKDIHHIKNAPFNLKPSNAFLFGSTLYYILLAAPVFIMMLIVIIWKKREKMLGDISTMKTRKANKVARTRLLKASNYKKEAKDKQFYDEIAQALWGYLSDKFNIPQSSLSIDTVKETLTSRGVDHLVTDNFVNTLNNIDFARFAPGDASGKMETVYNEALNAITRAEKILK